MIRPPGIPSIMMKVDAASTTEMVKLIQSKMASIHALILSREEERFEMITLNSVEWTRPFKCSTEGCDELLAAAPYHCVPVQENGPAKRRPVPEDWLVVQHGSTEFAVYCQACAERVTNPRGAEYDVAGSPGAWLDANGYNSQAATIEECVLAINATEALGSYVTAYIDPERSGVISTKTRGQSGEPGSITIDSGGRGVGRTLGFPHAFIKVDGVIDPAQKWIR